MSTITSKDIATLRGITGAGILDCKKALEATANNQEEAIKWLREKGISKAAKKNDRETHEGLVYSNIDGEYAGIVEIKCETDFVARNDRFVQFIQNVEQIIRKNNIHTVESALLAKYNNTTVQEELTHLSATIGEKLDLSRAQVIHAPGNTIGSYNHSNGKISTLVVLEGKVELEVARNIAMHVTALAPKYTTINDVPADVVASEKTEIERKAHEENEKSGKPKPANIIQNMIQGRLSKSLGEFCLVEQIYVKDPGIKVKDYLAQNKTNVLKVVRYELGK